MIKFTQTRLDWDNLKYGERMLKAGNDGYKSVYHDMDMDEYVLLSTLTQEELEKQFPAEVLMEIFEELENVDNKTTQQYTTSSGEIVELYWEIDKFS